MAPSLAGLPMEILHKVIVMACMSDLPEEGIYQSVEDMPQNFSLNSGDEYIFPISSATTGPQMLVDLDRHFLAQNGDIDRGPILALALTNRQLSSIANPLLYRWVDISARKHDFHEESMKARLFFLSIRRNPALWERVRNLSMDLPQSSPCFPPLPSANDYIEMLECLPNLRTLILHSLGRTDSLIGAAQILQLPNLRDSITALTFVGTMDIGKQQQALDTRILQAMPQFSNLQTLSVKALDGAVWLRNSSGERIQGIPIPIPVKEIILDKVLFLGRGNTTKYDPTLLEFFTWFEGLERVHIHTTKEVEAPDHVSELIRCLLPHRETLKFATVTAAGSFQGLWTQFTALEELGIPLRSFVGNTTFHSELPKNLKKLRFFLNEEWPMKHWSECVQTLFEAKEEGLLVLEELWLEFSGCFNQEWDEGGWPYEMATVDDLDELLQRLTEEGDAAGIRLEVVMDEDTYCVLDT